MLLEATTLCGDLNEAHNGAGKPVGTKLIGNQYHI